MGVLLPPATGQGRPAVDLRAVALLAAFAGNGGLTNAPPSSDTRDAAGTAATTKRQRL